MKKSVKFKIHCLIEYYTILTVEKHTGESLSYINLIDK